MVWYKTARQIVKATIAEASKATGIEDFSGCRGGGDIGMAGCPHSLHARERGLSCRNSKG